MLCEFCKVERQEPFLLNLPCGYLVCYEHIESIKLASSCFMCQEHSLFQKACYEIKKNREKLKKIKYLEAKTLLTESLAKIDCLRDDNQIDIKKKISTILNQIDLKRELLKNELNGLIDKYYLELVDKAKSMETEIIERIKVELNKVDDGQVREKLQSLSSLDSCNDDLSFYTNETKILSQLYEEKIEDFFKNYEKIEQIQFKEAKTWLNFDPFDLFGTIDSTNVPFSIQKRTMITTDNSISQYHPKKKFKSIGQFGHVNFIQLSSKELVFTSFPQSDILVYVDLENNQITKRYLYSKINFILSFEDKVVTITDSNLVYIRDNYTLLRTFKCPQDQIFLADLFDEKLYLVDTKYKVSVRKYLNGEVVKKFNFGKIFAIKALDNDLIVTGHEDMIAIWNFDGVKIDSIKTTDWVKTIERVNHNKIAAGLIDGKICVWNTTSMEFVIKKCHNFSMRFIQSCPNNHILSVCLDEINIWTLDLNLVQKIIVPHLYFGTVLSDGKLAYVDSTNQAYVCDD